MKLQIRNTVDNNIINIKKSIADNLKNTELFQSESEDTATNNVTLKPPVPFSDCKYVFDNSSYVAKCCRIKAQDIILNTLTLVNESDAKYDTVVQKIQSNLVENITELYFMLIDYYYAGLGVIEYAYGTHKFTLKQIPVNTTSIIRVTYQNQDYYLLQQKIQTHTNYFKIMGEEYPPTFSQYNGQPLGECALMGGDNFYNFFATPLWVQEKDKIFTEIAISNKNYNTISNGNIATGILNINLEPQPFKPVVYDELGNETQTKSREEIIAEELTGTENGIAVVFTESNRPISFDFTNIENNNYEYLEVLQEKAEQSVLNCYNIPLARLMINTEKESMNSNKTQSIWEIYTLDLKTEQSKIKEYIKELIFELYSIEVSVEIEVPLFSDRKEIEINNLINEWNAGLLTLKQTIEGLSEYTSVIDLKQYDFTINPALWEYRKLENYWELSADELIELEKVEGEIDALK